MRLDPRKMTTLGILLLTGIALLAFGSSPAFAIPVCPVGAPDCGATFTINEGTVPGVPINPYLVSANAIHFSFGSTAIESTIPGAFTETGAAIATGFSLNSGAPIPPGVFLNGVAPGGYILYAVYDAKGVSTFTANPGEIFDVYSAFNVHLFIDPDQSVTIDSHGNVIGLNGDEKPVGNGTLLPPANCAPSPSCGTDSVFINQNNKGDFRAILDFTAVALAGGNYFAAPNPFYSRFDFAGEIHTSEFPNCPTTNPADCTNFNSFQSGSGDAFFQAVPGPTSLLLLGVGLGLASALARRRRA